MNTKTILTATLLALALLAPPAAPAARPARAKSLAGDEKREARELAVRVVTRLKEAGDAGEVSAEIFVEDFAEHFRRFVVRGAGQGAETTPIDPRVVAQAGASDLRRAYAALLNLWVQHDLASDYEYRLAWSAGADDGPAPPALRDALPPDFFDEAGVDPLVAAIKTGLFGLGEDGEDLGGRAAPARIGSVERLRSFTAGLEACVEQLRRGVGRLKAEAEASEQASGRRANPEDEGEAVKNSIYRVEAETLEEEQFGLPAGALLIRVRAWPYVVLLARQGGRLRVLGVCPDIDGD